MKSINDWHLSGTVGGDAEVKQTQGGAIVSFSIAVSSNYKDEAGQWKEKTEWVRCTMFKGEGLAPYITKGSKVFLSGKPKFRAYKDKAGEAAVMPEIIVSEIDIVTKKPEGIPF